jgi:hypothetical protein
MIPILGGMLVLAIDHLSHFHQFASLGNVMVPPFALALQGALLRSGPTSFFQYSPHIPGSGNAAQP